MKRIRKEKKNSYKRIILLMGLLIVFITAKGLSANLDQKNQSLQKEVAELASTNQWIKSQISDKISLDKIEAYARENLLMMDAAGASVTRAAVDMERISQTNTVATESTWTERLQQNVGDIFNGKQ